ncbi:hypothetical protein ONS95_002416 [Cadophora gregata]|uniref:uncharacterized protein n=1 Tax=Cadophora gregata TaxID=51156 RepID=UPI0026DC9BB5|nr:uncharacterized protein ONS95_002416 [Cadophora gregata]KAK0109738.1 hypothetical protein ONS95_002416 [Cadophora gregata]KAK0110630.1 hypothetical protein ONS96_002233 [Cadophora gregata f. sp. sojae]
MAEPPSASSQEDPEVMPRQLRSPTPEEAQSELVEPALIGPSQAGPVAHSPSPSQQSPRPPRSGTPITNDNFTATPSTPNRDASAIADLNYDDDEDFFPSHDEILSRPVIKEVPLTPLTDNRSDGNKIEKASPGSQEEADDLDDDRYIYEKPESDDENTFEGDAETLFVPDSKKRKGQGKSTGPRARTAREYHARKNAKTPNEKKRGCTWKRNQLIKLREKMTASTEDKKQEKTSSRKFKGAFNPSVFLNSKSTRKASRKASRGFGTKSGITTNKKQGYLEIFLARYPHLDLHRCKTDWSDLSKKSASFGYDRMQKHGDMWLLKGMETSIYNHQMMGSAWMIQRECSAEGPYGGIVADDMGSGKTVTTITTIVGNPQDPGKPVKTTLVIVPPGLRAQWWDELVTHAPEVSKMSMVYDSKNIDKSGEKLRMCEVVITSYNEVIKSLPQPDVGTIQEWTDQKLDVEQMTFKWTQENMDGAELLHQVPWYRIVIDEAHNIKNPETRLFKAAYFLDGEHRWVLSGTPIMNRYEEFHSLFRFIKDPLTESMTTAAFRTQFCNPKDKISCQSLGLALSDIIIRRSINDTIMDEPIVKLPQLFKEIRQVKRYLPERLLYTMMRKCLRQLCNRSFRADDERKKLTTPLPQLTLKKQLIAHPDLVGRKIMVVLGIAGMKELRNQLNEIKLVRKSKRLAKVLQNRLDTWIEAKERDDYRDKDPDDAICFLCGEPDEDLHVLKKCEHILCENCLSLDQNIVVKEKGDTVQEFRLCPHCEEPYKNSDKKHLLPEVKLSTSKAKKSVRKGKDAREFRPALSPNQAWPLAWLKSFDREKSGAMLPSAKLRGTLEQVETWLEEAPSDKIIVFTQFKLFAIQVGIMLEKKKHKFVYYTGDMSTKDRDAAIRKMKFDSTVKVMIAGLKCGGIGLNFQFANRGIITDIWWNNCIDDQALCRFYRMGQGKPSYLVRIVVTKTVDSKIINLQEDKREAIGDIMQDKTMETDKFLDEVLDFSEDEPDDDSDTSDEEDGHTYNSADEDGF